MSNPLPALPPLQSLPAPAVPATLPENGHFSPRLSRKQKAAIVVRIILANGAKLSLVRLPDSLQTELTEQMGALRLVDRDTMRDVVAEFVDELEAVGFAFSGGIEGALTILDGTISPITSGRMRKEVGLKSISDPWQRIGGLETERLLPILQGESIEVCAVLLSKLNVAKSADLLGQIPGARARRIAYAMSLTAAVTPDAVDRIGNSLAGQLDSRPATAFSEGPVERVGAILNSSPAITRDDVLRGLDEADADFANKVRKAIFTFANIPARIDPRDIAKIIRRVEQPVLVAALIAARSCGDTASSDFVLTNMSKRMAEQLEEEMNEKGKVKQADGEDAMNAIVAEIRALEAAGEIFLVAEENE